MRNYEDFKHDLLSQESSSDPTIINSKGYVGLYQMGEDALQDAGYYKKNPNATRRNSWNGTWTGKDGIHSLEDFRRNAIVQDNAIEALFERNIREMKKHNLDRFIGTQITTPDGKTITITESGMIAGAHIGGATGLRYFLESGGQYNPNDNDAKGRGNSIADYIEKFAGYDTHKNNSPDNDAAYTPPLGLPDPGADNPALQSTVTMQPLSAQFEETGGENAGSFLGGLGNIMSGVTDFFSHAFDRITGNTPRQQARAMMANDDFYRQMGLNPASLEKLLENGMESLMGKITEHLTRGGNVGSLALGRTLAQHPTMLADIMRASRRKDMSASLEELFMGKDGSGGLMTDFIGNAVAGGINQLLGVGKVRTRTSSAESERSRETARNWNYSRGQQQAMVAAWVAAGQRNL